MNSRVILEYKDELTNLEVNCWQFWKTLQNGRRSGRIYSVEALHNGDRIMFEAGIDTSPKARALAKRTFKVLRDRYRGLIDALPGGG